MRSAPVEMWLNMILIYSSDTWDHTITMMMERMRWDLEISIMEEVTPEMRVSYRSSIYFFTGTLIFPSILRRIHLLEYCTIFLYTTILDTAFPLHLGSDMWGSEWEDGFGHGVEFGRILVSFFFFILWNTRLLTYFCQARLHEIDFHPRGNVPKLDFPLEAPYSEWLISLLIREEP